ncbi:MAG: squalene synthase HpnC [Phycisphaeraceae bacterium]|nr:squalene synthase HpnC [Phycisphaeraceae bacterium]
MASAILAQLDQYGPQRCLPMDREQAAAYAKALTESQYENFTVVSRLLPRDLREDFHAIYSFCRWADDLGDETGDPRKSKELLDWWRRELDGCYAGSPRHPVFVALQPVVQRHEIPRKPFDDLIDAFLQDQQVTRYATWEQVLDYCTRSADPVGRLVLYVCGYRDEERQKLSDATCTALQLTNFWQDVRRDILERDRVYVPSEVASRHGLDIGDMVAAVKGDEKQQCEQSGACCAAARQRSSVAITALLPAYRATVRELAERTWPLFERGHGLWPRVSPRLRTDIQLFSLGGQSILKMIEKRDYDTLTQRPRLSKGRKMALLMRAVAARLWGHSFSRNFQ